MVQIKCLRNNLLSYFIIHKNSILNTNHQLNSFSNITLISLKGFPWLVKQKFIQDPSAVTFGEQVAKIGVKFMTNKTKATDWSKGRVIIVEAWAKKRKFTSLYVQIYQWAKKMADHTYEELKKSQKGI